MAQPHLHRLPELSRWGNILSPKSSCLTAWTANSDSLGLASLPCPSLELLPSHCFPPALPLPPTPGVLPASPQGTGGWCSTDMVLKLPVPSLSPPCVSPEEKGGARLGLELTLTILSQPSITPLFLSLHGGGLISHLTVLGGGKASRCFI